MLGETCIKHECPGWINVTGLHPQTGEIMDRWNCGPLHWQTLLMVENSKVTREVGGEVEALRKEVDKANKMHTAIEGQKLRMIANGHLDNS